MFKPYIGEIRMFGGVTFPIDWHICDGSLLSIQHNEALFSVIGIAYGGDGLTTFALPDMRGRVPIHNGQAPGLNNYNLGENGGKEKVSLNADELPPHSHEMSALVEGSKTGEPVGNTITISESEVYFKGSPDRTNMHPEAISNTGGGQPHPNVMPFACINFIIAISGVLPHQN